MRSGQHNRFARSLLAATIPNLCIELLARLGGYVTAVLGHRSALGAEARVRAYLYNLKYGYKAQRIGRQVVIDDPTRVTLGRGVALNTGVIIKTGRRGWCVIEDRSHVSNLSVLAASGGIRIGPDCAVSSGVVIYSMTYDRENAHESPVASRVIESPVNIEGSGHIGANVTILPGIRIGRFATVGAGAVVTRDVAEGKTVGGVPARPLRES